MSASNRSFGLCMYGIQYAVGAAGRDTPLANPRPLDAGQFLDLAMENELASIEVPLSYVSPELDRRELNAYRDRAAEAGIRIVVAGPRLPDADNLPQQLELCPEIGADTFRCVMSGLLCGDRRPMGGYGGWQAHVDTIIAKLRSVVPVAERVGVRIGVENHQDADSSDLLRVCETVGSPFVGVTLDTGNPLAVGEDPVEFAEKILPHLVDVHLKDYRMINTPEGYRLVHCAIGDGVVDFEALWKLFARRANLPRGIEMASLYERHIRLLTDEYWDGFGRRPVRTLVPVLRLWREHGEDAEDWQTPIETGKVDGAVEWEMERFARSVRNMTRIDQL